MLRRPYARDAVPGTCPVPGGVLASVVVVALAVLGIGASPAHSASCVPGNVGYVAEARMLALVNAERSARGLRPLNKSPRLHARARATSRLFARGGTFGHGSLSWAGRGPGAQNLAMAPNAWSAFRGMMESPAHRQNMLGARWRTIGVGAAGNCRGSVYFTVNIAGAPRR